MMGNNHCSRASVHSDMSCPNLHVSKGGNYYDSSPYIRLTSLDSQDLWRTTSFIMSGLTSSM